MSDEGTEHWAAWRRLQDHDGWMNRVCQGTTIAFWFPAPGEQRGDRLAREAAAADLCMRCPLLAACREYAITWEPHGVWGGLSPTERRQLRAERRRAEASRVVALPTVTDGVTAEALREAA